LNGDYEESGVYAYFYYAANAVNRFIFSDSSLYKYYKEMIASLHLLSVTVDDQIQQKIKDKETAKTHHEKVMAFMKRDVPNDDETMIAEYRNTADEIIRTYSKLMSEAFPR
jgi:hypothetical protein